MKLHAFTAATVTLVALSPLARAGSGGCDWSAKKGGGCGSSEETTAKTGNATVTPSAPSAEKEKTPKEGDKKPVS